MPQIKSHLSVYQKKQQLIVRTKYSFCCHLRETYVKTKKKKVFYETTMQKLDMILKRFKFFNYLPFFEYIEEFMTLHEKDPMLFWTFYYKLTPQLIKFNIPIHD